MSRADMTMGEGGVGVGDLSSVDGGNGDAADQGLDAGDDAGGDAGQDAGVTGDMAFDPSPDLNDPFDLQF